MSAAKHTPGPVPASKFDAFVSCMNAADNDDLPDGAWFAVLEETAARFMKENGIRGDELDATHQWIQATGSAA